MHITISYNKILHITGAIVQRDDGVLINNRLEKKIPIVDEVGMVDKVPLGMICAVEVAAVGGVVEVLSNPYGIATLFKLTPDETKQVVPIARALIGNRSAVVIKTPEGDVKERRIPAGSIRRGVRCLRLLVWVRWIRRFWLCWRSGILRCDVLRWPERW